MESSAEKIRGSWHALNPAAGGPAQHMSRALLAGAAILLATVAVARADCVRPQKWIEYVNFRFGMRIDVPADCFVAQPPPANGDGRLFESEDGRGQLAVYGSRNVQGHNPKRLEAWLAEEVGGYDEVTYAPMGSDWLVLSGYRGERIFYEKYIFSHGGAILNSFWVTFPRDEKPVFGPLIERMEDTFRPGEGADTP